MKVDTPGIVEVAEDALLGHFEYSDNHRLLQIGVILEALHHEAADEGDHFIVKVVGVGGVAAGCRTRPKGCRPVCRRRA